MCLCRKYSRLSSELSFLSRTLHFNLWFLIPSINQVLALLRNWSCFSVAKTRWRLSLTVTSAWKKPSGMWSSSKLKSRSTGSLGLEFCLSRFAACANNFGFERPGHGPSSFSRRTYKNEEGKNFNKGIYTWHCSNCIC